MVSTVAGSKGQPTNPTGVVFPISIARAVARAIRGRWERFLARRLHEIACNRPACNRSALSGGKCNRDNFQNRRSSRFAGALLFVGRKSRQICLLPATGVWQRVPTPPTAARGRALRGSGPSARAFFLRRENSP